VGGFLYQLPVEYYVSTTGSDSNSGTRASPFLTIGRAQTAVRAIGGAMNRDVVVYLRDGRYEISSTQTFTPLDSGQNGYTVTYRSFPNETARISGGQAIGSWSDQGGGLWRASTSLNFRQLYVNGVRATRCRYPKAGSYGAVVFWNTTDDEIELEAGHADEAADAQELVVVGEGVNAATLRISSVSGAVVTPQTTEQGRLFTQTYPPKGVGSPYFLQGGLDLCTDQGEWHLDTVNDFVYYRPLPGEDMATAEVIAPQVEQLVTLIGTDLDTPVHDIQFYGLTFEHATWLLPSTEGYVGDQSSTYFVEALPVDQITSYPSLRNAAAVYVNVADDLRFERCRWRHCGADGLHLYRGVTDATVIGNVFWDLSGGGVAVDLALLGNTGDSRVPCRRVTISNNYIELCGREFYQTNGIFTAYVDSPIIEQNEVTDMPYVGIAMGWGWENSANTMNGGIIRRNEVWDVCKLESDSGGIYTLSKQANGGSATDALIEHNYVHDIVRVAGLQGSFEITGIYTDQGTNNITIQNNVIDVPDADSDTFTNLNGGSVTFTNNGSAISGAATIAAAAGLEAAYEDIRALAV
jgi:hypothetical protein